jgi:hypothetical protein
LITLDRFDDLVDQAERVRLLQREYRRSACPFARRKMEAAELRLDALLIGCRIVREQPSGLAAAVGREWEAEERLAAELGCEPAAAGEGGVN